MRASRPVNLKSAAAAIFGLTAILPLLLFVFFLWHFDLLEQTSVQVGLGLALLIALLGFVVFQRLVGRITELVDSLREPTAQAAVPARTAVAGLGEVSEIGEIARSFGRMLEDLRSSTERLEDLVFKLGTLNEMVELVTKIPRPQELLGHVLERSMRTVRANLGSIMLLDPERQRLRVVVARGQGEEPPVGSEVAVGEGIAGTVVQHGEPVLVEDIETDPRFARPSDPRYGGGSFICMPLRVGARILGVVNLAKKEVVVGGSPRATSFSPSDLQFLNALMTHTAYAVDNARLLEEAQQSAGRLQEVVEDQKLRLTLAQQQAIQAAKLAAMGQLLAGVAHELNNPLSVVTGHAEVLLERGGDAELTARIQKIVDAADRCARIVKTFLALARQRPPERRPVRLNAVVKDALELLAHQLKLDGIEVQLTLAEEVPVLGGDPHQLHQVVMNLATNAQQAMRGGEGPRRLSVSTAFEAGPGRVVVVVEDTGPGIPPEIRSRIFEPFFTTKPEGQGTGLGLSLCYSIIESHGGSIRVNSQPGRGASFRIELPVGTPEAAAPAEPVADSALPRGRGRVLVVDDDAEVGQLLADFLAADGYQVDTAADGVAALDKLEGRSYDLVLSDVRMPQLDGPGLYREARRRRPGLRFVFITGDALGPHTREFLTRTGSVSLPKPLRREEVRLAVRHALREEGGGSGGGGGGTF